MITTLRYLKLWKRRGSAGTADGRAAVTAGSAMFRSPSSDSGYSDVQTTVALKPPAHADIAAHPGTATVPLPVELLPPSRSGVDRPAIRVTGPPTSPPPPQKSRQLVFDGRTRGKKLSPADDHLLMVSEHHRPVYVLRQQEMVSVEAFFDFVKRRDIDSIQYALRDAHYDIDSQDAVSSLSFLLSLFIYFACTATMLFFSRPRSKNWIA